ncbi:hypothetical protein [Massilia brevitalea]|uniref:hypothetical protein n=1 Tax=Massilia brevitalea TaxID=442526 RepID=UPI002739059C|nr:hypothetical protein [Massilia brevitalea]
MRLPVVFLGLFFPALVVAQQTADIPVQAATPKKVITFSTAQDLQAAAAAKAAEEEARRQAIYDEPVGKTYWFKPSEASEPVRFYQTFRHDDYLPNWGHLEDEIRPNVTVSFKVVERFILRRSGTDRYSDFYGYTIVFEDGTRAFADQSEFGFGLKNVSLKSYGYKPTNSPAAAVNPKNTSLFTEDPDLLAKRYAEEQERKALLEEERRAADAARLAAEQVAQLRAKAAEQKRAKAATRESKRRGGVALGMTPSQVRASNWGSPQRINRTTGSFGVHEQWVYSGGNFLYFENGVLTSVQN